MKRSFFVLAAALAVTSSAAAQTAPPLAHRFIKVADGVFAAVGNGTIQTQDTVAVVINRDDVLEWWTRISPRKRPGASSPISRR
jgi:hypothetical protein